MSSVTVNGGGGPSQQVVFSSNDSSSFGQALANQISAAFTSGALTASYTYISGPSAPQPASGAGGLLFVNTLPGQVLALGTGNAAVIITTASGTVSITGGAPGASVLAGSSGLVYTGITASGTATASIAVGGGNNYLQTDTAQGGRYAIATGSGADSIAILNGNATVNAGTGSNTVVLGGGPKSGNSVVASEGYDMIVGNTVAGGGGTDTINIGSGQTTVNPGSSSFFVFGGATLNTLTYLAGSGSGTVAGGLGASTITGGLAGHNLLIGGLSQQGSTITGGGNGDQILAIGAGSVNANAGAGANVTISGTGGTTPYLASYTAPGSTANNLFTAGSGNDTLLSGAGMDTLVGGSGRALMVAGTGNDTFAFTRGAGGADTISGFKASDVLQLNGFGTAASVVGAASISGGSTVLTLSGGTTITLAGVSNLSTAQVRTA